VKGTECVEWHAPVPIRSIDEFASTSDHRTPARRVAAFQEKLPYNTPRFSQCVEVKKPPSDVGRAQGHVKDRLRQLLEPCRQKVVLRGKRVLIATPMR